MNDNERVDKKSAGAGAGVVVCGAAGAGKTTLATEVARRLGYVIADLDTVTGALTWMLKGLLGTGESGIDGVAGGVLRAARYDALLAVAENNLGVGNGVVIAAPFSAERSDPSLWDGVVQRLVKAGGDRVLLVLLEVSTRVRLARLRERAAPRDKGKLGEPGWESGLRDVTGWLEPSALLTGPIGSVAVDGTLPISQQADTVLALLRRREATPC